MIKKLKIFCLLLIATFDVFGNEFSACATIESPAIITAKQQNSLTDKEKQKLFQDGLDYIKLCGASFFFFEQFLDREVLYEFERAYMVEGIDHMANKELMDRIYGTNLRSLNAYKGPKPSCVSIGKVIKSSDICSEYVNVINGVRLTSDTPEGAKHALYICGPCNVFGCFDSDEYTLPSYLQRMINQMSKDFYVVNLGVNERPVANDFYRILSTPLKAGDIVISFSLLDDQLKKVFAQNGIKINNPIDCFKPPRRETYLCVDHSIRHFNYKGSNLIANFMYKTIESRLRDIMGQDSSDKLTPVSQRFDVAKDSTIIEDFKAQTPDFKDYLENLKASRLSNAKSLKIGSVVVNCNPFTLGHRYLIEESLQQVDHLYIFVVEEDKSIFSFKDRMELVKAGVSDLKNVTVLPSGNGIISTVTFPEYFTKESSPHVTVIPTLDLEIFGKCICPVLSINCRFAGEEPIDQITRQYNLAMARELPRYGIEFHVISRKKSPDGIISASTVRKLLQDKNFAELVKYVPKTTLNYLLAYDTRR